MDIKRQDSFGVFVSRPTNYEIEVRKANERFLEGQLLGYFGAAVGVGRVLGLSTEQLYSTLGLALMQAGGIPLRSETNRC